MRFGSDEFYFKSPAEMKELFYDIPEAITNTIAIAERCNLDLQLGQFRFPKFDVPEGETLDGLLEKKAREGFARRMEQIRRRNPNMTDKDEEVYRTRFEFELGIIRKMGFAGYFLIVSDFINWAKSNGIPVGPGRGSAVGSLLAYCLGITELDPLVYGLLFERFLNPERKSMPDIDVDFCQERREEVLKYVSEKYGGKNYVAQIITFGKMQAKAAIRDAGRALGMSAREVDEVAKLVPNVLNISLEDAFKAEPRFAEIRSADRRIDELLNLATRMEGLTRHASTHAAGVVISDRPIIEYMPLYKGAHDEVVTQYDMKCVERIGLIKFDFLGLRTLTVIRKTQELVERTKGEKVDVNNLDLKDDKVWDLICRGETGGVFQLESAGMRELLVRMKPRRFEDLIAAVALYRPGPMSMLDDFIQRKQGKIPIKYPHPSMKPILEDTYGIILYQEQVMQIAQALAGYTRGEADVLRKAMGKKDVQVMVGQRKKFIEGAVAKGVNEQTATEIFDHVAKFGEYGFNKSHSAAYALIAYQTAFLKAYYPLEFMAALLTSEMDDTDNIIKYINECRDMGIEVRRPDINASDVDFTVEDGAIRFGLKAVKNVGEGAIEAIKEAREKGGPFKDLFDFPPAWIYKKSIGK
jgi:DNA polymerase-3 subunit alpha